MNVDELRKSVGYLRDLIGIEPPRKEESKEEMADSLLSLLQIDQNSYSDRVLGGDEAEVLYELRKAEQLAKNIKRRPAYRMKKRHMVSIRRHNFLRDNAIAIVEGRIDSLGEAEEYFAMQHLVDTDKYKELSGSKERRCVILYAQMGDEITPSQKMIDEGLVTLPVTKELYHKAEEELSALLLTPDQVDALLDNILGENENPIYQELKEIKERIEILMKKL